MVGAAASLVAMALLVRVLAPDYDVLELIFLRNAVNLCLMVPWIVRAGPAGLGTRRLVLHAFRNALHYAGNLAWFFAVTMVSLAELSALQFTMPIFTVVMAALVLGERVDAARALVVAAGFAGALIVLRPDVAAPGAGQLVALAAAFLYAASFVATKRLSETESANAVVFYMSVFVLLFSAAPAAFVWKTPDAADLPAIIGLGAAGYATHYCVTRAMAAAEASFVVPFDFLRLPMSAAAGIALFAEPLRATTVVGAAVIFAAAWINTRREERGRGRGQPSAAAASAKSAGGGR